MKQLEYRSFILLKSVFNKNKNLEIKISNFVFFLGGMDIYIKYFLFNIKLLLGMKYILGGVLI